MASNNIKEVCLINVDDLDMDMSNVPIMSLTRMLAPYHQVLLELSENASLDFDAALKAHRGKLFNSGELPDNSSYTEESLVYAVKRGRHVVVLGKPAVK